MKITDIQASVIGRREPHSGGSVWTFVRIYTDEGIVGTGECNSAGPARAVKEMVLNMKPLLLGENPLDVARLYEVMRRRHRYSGGSSAPLIFAISGIEMALWDIGGKALGVPISQLLGGKFRDRIRLYADCHAGEANDPQAYGEKALEVLEEGYTALKFDVDNVSPGKFDAFNRSVGSQELKHILSLVQGVREAVGPEVDLAIDCHGAFDLGSGIRIAKGMEDFDLMWLEEPVPAENIEALAQVRASSSTLICTGENLYTRFDFRELFEARAADIIMPDIPKVGGLLEARRIADMADVYYIPVAPHNVSSPLGMMAACHVLASIPNFLVLEFHGREIAWWEDMCLGDRPFIRDGFMHLSEAPGIGVELNHEVARTLLAQGETYFAS